MLSHTARIHSTRHEALYKPFADRDALDCSPPFKLALALARLRKRADVETLAPRMQKPSLFAKMMGRAA